MKTTFQRRLKEAMTARKLRQVDLSNMTGMGESNISQYCNGVRTPRGDALLDLAQVLNVDAAWLMGYDTEMSRRPRGVSPPVTGMSSGVSVSSPGELTLLASYRSLNAAGQERLLERASELADHPRYREAAAVSGTRALSA